MLLKWILLGGTALVRRLCGSVITCTCAGVASFSSGDRCKLLGCIGILVLRERLDIEFPNPKT